MEIYKLLIYKIPLCLHTILGLNDINSRIILPNLYLTHYQQGFSYQGPRLWNLIRSNLRETFLNCKFTTVKYKLKKLLLRMQFYSANSNNAENWIPANFNLETFLTQVKKDPYNTL